jgi:hypothetical protein
MQIVERGSDFFKVTDLKHRLVLQQGSKNGILFQIYPQLEQGKLSRTGR